MSGAMTELPSAFRCAMRRLASGVGVVAAIGPDGATGMAATSITSLALDPPSLLVCVNRQASLHACLAPGARFCVSLLGFEHRDIAAAFGGAVARHARFSIGEWSMDAQGIPRLDGAQANFSCAVDQMVAYGTHTIVVGRVDAVRTCGEVTPLIFQDGRYL